MTAPEEAKSEVEAAFSEYVDSYGPYFSVNISEQTRDTLKRAFAAGAKFAADLNQEKLAQLIKEVD